MIGLLEAKTLNADERVWLQKVYRSIQQHIPQARLILYGSTARGSRTPESDYDLLILTPQPLPSNLRDTLREEIYDIELAHDLVLSILFLDPDQWEQLRCWGHPFWQNVSQEGILIE
jgi:predicted nucleotidyltransferase